MGMERSLRSGGRLRASSQLSPHASCLGVKLENEAKLGIRVAAKNLKSAPFATLKDGICGFPAAGDEFAELQKKCSCNPDRRKSFVCVPAELQELQIVAECCSCNSSERREA